MAAGMVYINSPVWLLFVPGPQYTNLDLIIVAHFLRHFDPCIPHISGNTREVQRFEGSVVLVVKLEIASVFEQVILVHGHGRLGVGIGLDEAGVGHVCGCVQLIVRNVDLDRNASWKRARGREHFLKGVNKDNDKERSEFRNRARLQ